MRAMGIDTSLVCSYFSDLNEFSFVDPLNALVGGSPAVLKEVTVQSRVERYSYIFQQNCQELVRSILLTYTAETLYVC